MSESSFFWVGSRKKGQSISRRQRSYCPSLWALFCIKPQLHEGGHPANMSLQGSGPIS